MRRIFRLPRRYRIDRDVDDEIGFHLEMREAKLRLRGLSPGDAASEARRRFGDVEAIRQDCVRTTTTLARREQRMSWMDESRLDLRFALRSLARAKAFSLAVVATLALGIGASAMVFALLRAVVLSPVHGIREAARVFELSDVFSYTAYRDARAGVPALDLAAASERRMALGAGEAAEHTVGALVSGNWFDLMGVRAAVGRVIRPEDDVAGGGPVAVLAHGYWLRAFGGDPSVIGRSLTVNGAPVTIVGVAAREFRGTHLGQSPDIWLPVHAWQFIHPSSQRVEIDAPGWDWLRVTGRLPAGMTAERAHAALTNALLAATPGEKADQIAPRTALRSAQAAALASGAREAAVRFGAILAVVVGLVLLTACANIAGLLLSRATYRQREIAVRAALGAGRGRLARQLLTEAIVLAGAGGGAGVLAFAAGRALLARVSLPGGMHASELGITADARLIAFAFVVTLVTGVLVGLAPALQASRPDTVAAMKGAQAARGSRTHRLRGALVSAQVAAGLVLLMGTGLFLRALTHALALEPGFRVADIALLQVDPGLAQLDPARAAEYYEAVLARVPALAGVVDVTWASAPPLTSGFDRETVDVEGYIPRQGERVALEYASAGPRYHRILDIPMLAGRGFEAADDAGAPPVLILNETAAGRYFAGRDPIGAQVKLHGVVATVIGVARDISYHELNEEARPYAWLPLLQVAAHGGVGAPTLMVRTTGDAARHLPAIVEMVRSVDPRVPVARTTTMSAHLNDVLAPQLAGAWLLGVFSLLVLAVAAVGIHGVVAYAVSQRTREIGIRMALGARAWSVVRVVVMGNLGFIALGIAAGLVMALLLARGMTRFLYGVGSADALTLAATIALVLAVGIVASLLPARRAVRIDPLVALRAES